MPVSLHVLQRNSIVRSVKNEQVKDLQRWKKTVPQNKGGVPEQQIMTNTSLVLKHMVQHLPSPSANRMCTRDLVEAGFQKFS